MERSPRSGVVPMSRPRRLSVALAGAAALALLGLGFATAPAPAADRGPLSGKEIYQHTLKAMVWIVNPIEVADNKVRIGTGSGSLIDVPQRLVLTNFHVVRNKDKVTVLFPQF